MLAGILAFSAIFVVKAVMNTEDFGDYLPSISTNGGADKVEKKNKGDSAINSPEELNSFSKDDWNLVLVNAENPISDDYEYNLVDYENTPYKIDSRIKPFYDEMVAAAKKDGVDIKLRSGYRDFKEQTTYYNARVATYLAQGYKKSEAERLAARIIAKPTTSEHHTGLAVDVVTQTYQVLNEEFANTDAGKWLAKNCYKYGFILRYTEEKSDITGVIYEPWHFRYVGVEAAGEIKERGICLEEFLDLLER